MKRYSDVIIGVILTLLAVMIIFMSSPLPEQSAIFPKVIAGILIFLSGLMILASIKAGKQEGQKNEVESRDENIDMKDVLKGGALILSYILLMPKLGFFATTALFISLFMFVFKERSIKKIIGTALLLNLFIYFIFVTQLNVPLPQGLIF